MRERERGNGDLYKISSKAILKRFLNFLLFKEYKISPLDGPFQKTCKLLLHKGICNYYPLYINDNSSISNISLKACSNAYGFQFLAK